MVTFIAVSAAKRFAYDDCSVARLPWSSSHAACQTSRRAASISAAMSATRKLTPWFIAIAWPNWTRSFEYSTACSKAARATPTAPAAVPGRVRSSVCIAILKPCPSSPSRLEAGTFTSWKASAEVSVARWPILSRCFSTTTPSVSVGTMKAVSPRWRASLSVEANTITHEAWPALVMNIFEPLMT